MKNKHYFETLAYECINSIGNSLKLDEMLHDVISTFVQKTGAIGGKYISYNQETKKYKSIVDIGKDFELTHDFSKDRESFSTVNIENKVFLLNIPIKDENFVFCFKQENDLKFLGNMFSSFSLKLINAINACRSVEKLHSLNEALISEVNEEKTKNILNEKVMINQSRMAIMGEMIGMIAHQWRQPIEPSEKSPV